MPSTLGAMEFATGAPGTLLDASDLSSSRMDDITKRGAGIIFHFCLASFRSRSLMSLHFFIRIATKENVETKIFHRHASPNP